MELLADNIGLAFNFWTEGSFRHLLSYHKIRKKCEIIFPLSLYFPTEIKIIAKYVSRKVVDSSRDLKSVWSQGILTRNVSVHRLGILSHQIRP